MESKSSIKAKDKSILLDFESQVKDLRQQFAEQVRCLEARTESEVALVAELQEYYKRRGEIEQDYARSLDKLAKVTVTRCSADKQKKNFSQFSLYTFWKQLVASTKLEAYNRNRLAESYNSVTVVKLSRHADALQRISKRCRDIAGEAQQEILRVLSELHTALKTYQLCHVAVNHAAVKFRTIEKQKLKFERTFPGKVGNRRYRFIQREYQAKQTKLQDFELKCLKARNEYILCIGAANAALQKYYAEDVPDILDCVNIGSVKWVTEAIETSAKANQCICHTQQNIADATEKFCENMDTRADKQRFFELNHSTFALPRKFEFCPQNCDQITEMSAHKFVADDLIQRFLQLCQRLTQLRTETEEIWKTLETAEKGLMHAIALPEIRIEDVFRSSVDIVNDDSNLPSRSHSFRTPDAKAQKVQDDLEEIEEFYLTKFREYVLIANLIGRLQARHDAIGTALGAIVPDSENCSSLSLNTISAVSIEEEPALQRLLQEKRNLSRSLPPKARKKRIGRTIESRNQRPKLFGGSLEEYVEATGEEIPTVIRSCIRMLSLYGLHHQGVFRISGSQLEINNLKEGFEKGEDPLANVADANASDVNSVSGVMKLYFRELREPLFPLYMFDQFIACGKSDVNDFVSDVRDLVMTLPRPIFVVMRYLFAFLNHLSEFSDENMMDPYNLAICWGPTLIPIPECRDQVEYHNAVNNLVKNLIIYQENIFSNDGGPVYEKYMLSIQQSDLNDRTDEIMSDEEPAALNSEDDAPLNALERLSLLCPTSAADDIDAFDMSSSVQSTCSLPFLPTVGTGHVPLGARMTDSFCSGTASIAGTAEPPSPSIAAITDPVWIRMEHLQQLVNSLRQCSQTSSIERPDPAYSSDECVTPTAQQQQGSVESVNALQLELKDVLCNLGTLNETNRDSCRENSSGSQRDSLRSQGSNRSAPSRFSLTSDTELSAANDSIVGNNNQSKSGATSFALTAIKDAPDLVQNLPTDQLTPPAYNALLPTASATLPSSGALNSSHSYTASDSGFMDASSDAASTRLSVMSSCPGDSVLVKDRVAFLEGSVGPQVGFPEGCGDVVVRPPVAYRNRPVMMRQVSSDCNEEEAENNRKNQAALKKTASYHAAVEAGKLSPQRLLLSTKIDRVDPKNRPKQIESVDCIDTDDQTIDQSIDFENKAAAPGFTGARSMSKEMNQTEQTTYQKHQRHLQDSSISQSVSSIHAACNSAAELQFVTTARSEVSSSGRRSCTPPLSWEKVKPAVPKKPFSVATVADHRLTLPMKSWSAKDSVETFKM